MGNYIKGDKSMDIKLPVLKVQMLGGLSLTWGDTVLSFSRKTATKAIKLLQILLYYGEKGISRNELIENLYKTEELMDALNSLRVTAYRMKKMLVNMGLPEYNYIKISKGIYYWNGPMETKVDVHQFCYFIRKSEKESDEEERINWLRKACDIFKGELLPNSSEDEWVLIENLQCKKMYDCALQQLCDYLWSKEEYEVILRLCQSACIIYPLDKWQSVCIDCFIAMKRYQEAIEEYELTAKMFFEEMGIRPSEEVIDQFKLMSEHMSDVPQNIYDIKNHLREDEIESGAFYMTLPSFRDSYRLVRRNMERNGQSVYLMLCSLVDRKGAPMGDSDKLDKMSEKLALSIKACLRKGDSFTRYNPSQFLILLVGTNSEGCSLVFERIERYFSAEHESWKKYLKVYFTSLVDEDRNDIELVLRKNGVGWMV